LVLPVPGPQLQHAVLCPGQAEGDSVHNHEKEQSHVQVSTGAAHGGGCRPNEIRTYYKFSENQPFPACLTKAPEDKQSKFKKSEGGRPGNKQIHPNRKRRRWWEKKKKTGNALKETG